jgi:hypothetical protein
VISLDRPRLCGPSILLPASSLRQGKDPDSLSVDRCNSVESNVKTSRSREPDLPVGQEGGEGRLPDELQPEVVLPLVHVRENDARRRRGPDVAAFGVEVEARDFGVRRARRAAAAAAAAPP